MKKSAILACLSLICFINACDDDDNTPDDSTSKSAISYFCQNNIQTAVFADQTSTSLSCANYGGCDVNLNRCVNPPQIQESSATPAFCTNNSFKCASNARFVCDQNNWIAVETCDNGCNEITNACITATPQPKCTNGDKKCGNNSALLCFNNIWVITEICGDLGCDATSNTCKSDNQQATECTNGDTKCEKNFAYTCIQNSWVITDHCGELGCDLSTNTCASAITEPDCTSGQKKCENNMAFVCENNTWNSGISCVNGCDLSTNECANTTEPGCTDGIKNAKITQLSSASMKSGLSLRIVPTSAVMNPQMNAPAPSLNPIAQMR